MRHADLRREATAVMAKPASALLYDSAVVPGTGVWACGYVFCDAMGSKTGVNFFD